MRTQILIITDSRGTDLQKNIRKMDTNNRLQDIDIMIIVLRGANLDDGFERLAEKIDVNSNFNTIYVMLGVNNLSVKNSVGKINPMYSDIPTLIEMMTTKFEIFKYQIKQMSNRVVLCQLVGMNLSMYNKGYPTFELEQCVINEAMPILAHTLNLINRENQLISPWLTKIIHYRVNHKLYNAYGKLTDGVHYSESMKSTVAKRLLEAILKNLNT